MEGTSPSAHKIMDVPVPIIPIAEKISDAELKKKALVLLNQKLGPANTVRFLSMYSAGAQDYMAIRDELFKDMSAKQVFEEAAAFWQTREH